MYIHASCHVKDGCPPTSTAVLEYHKHLLAAKRGVRALGTPNSPPGGKAGGQAGKPLCKFFLGASGCKRGGKCTYVHGMSGLTRQEREKKCLACGSEAHRQKDCPSVGVGSPKARASSREGGATFPNKQSNMGTGGNQPGIDPGRAEESLAAFMRMVYAASNASASSSNPVPVTASPSSSVPPGTSQPPALEDKPLSQEECRVSTIRLRAIEQDL